MGKVIEASSRVKYRRPLNSQQIDVLAWLFKFRFSTSKQIAESLGRSQNSYKGIQKKLQILEEQELIAKRYDKSYKLQGRAAEYCLTPKGARWLEQARPNTTNQWAAKSLYKNKSVSQDFIIHCLNIADAALKLQAVYGDKLKIFTKSVLIAYDYFPTWPPDLLLSLQSSRSKERLRYFFDVWDGTKPFFISVRKARNYLNYADEGDWPDDEVFPAVLAICEDSKTQKKLNRQIKHFLSDSYVDETVFATTTQERLANQNWPNERIWLRIEWDSESEKNTLASLFVNP
jgi:DNA-binding MarR family transcriptional regulator